MEMREEIEVLQSLHRVARRRTPEQGAGGRAVARIMHKHQSTKHLANQQEACRC
jgi:hypothetical protein